MDREGLAPLCHGPGPGFGRKIASAALVIAPDDPAAGPDDRLGHQRPPCWVERASQALGHRPRAPAAAVRSIPVNSSSVMAAGTDRLRCRLRSRRHRWLFLGPHRLVIGSPSRWFAVFGGRACPLCRRVRVAA
jgi:hypothetical protein